MEFRCQTGLGFNLCIAPPQDCGVPILEGKGMGYGGMEEQRFKDLELTWS